MDIWGVTRHPATSTGNAEGITVIELFATEALAIAFRDGYKTRRRSPDWLYGVTKFKVWDGPIDGHGLT